jgi:hypothetical protein
MAMLSSQEERVKDSCVCSNGSVFRAGKPKNTAIIINEFQRKSNRKIRFPEIAGLSFLS